MKKDFEVSMKLFLMLNLIFILAIVAGCGVKTVKTIISEWSGASQDELVRAWGFPETQNDLVTIDNHTQVFTYRSFNDGFDGPAICVISFTLTDKIVTQWKYRGANCTKIERK